MRRTAAVTLLALVAAPLAALGAGPAAAAQKDTKPVGPTTTTGLRDVMFVGNNWAGTASIVDAHTRTVLKSGIDLVPDKDQELADIHSDPEKLAFYLAVQQGPGEGHDQYVDDMFTTRDGRYLAVSRPSFADVVWIDIAKAVAGDPESIVREQSMDGHRSDHMGLSPDGRRLLVSDSTEAQVIEYSMVEETVAGQPVKVGDRMRTFESGETPHESNYSADGSRIFHASIGKVYTPGDDPVLDASKGDRWFEIVNNSDFTVAQRWDMGKELAEAGYPGMSAAVRPMAVAPGERFIYYQVSFFHGLIEFDTQAPDIDGVVDYSTGSVPEPRTGAVTRVIDLPNRVPSMPREQYVNDSAHHGLAINAVGTTLCAAGTMDDYVALVDRATMTHRLFDQQTTGHYYGKPYWTTQGPDDTCWVSLSDADSVAVIDFKRKKEIAYFPVGDHPQRIRQGVVEESMLATPAAGSATAPASDQAATTAPRAQGETDGAAAASAPPSHRAPPAVQAGAPRAATSPTPVRAPTATGPARDRAAPAVRLAAADTQPVVTNAATSEVLQNAEPAAVTLPASPVRRVADGTIWRPVDLTTTWALVAAALFLALGSLGLGSLARRTS